MRFVDEIARSFPPGLCLPAEFESLLVWMEENGFVHAYTRRDGRYASLYPAALEGRGTSLISFHPVDPGHAEAWIGRGVPGTERLAPFIRTGGDGSYAALWRDPEDRPRFVHLGSGSGSIWAGVITDDAVEMLRFLAIGYDEACWPEIFAATPAEAREENDFADEAAFEPPRRFQDWVRRSFGVTIPERGNEIVREAPGMDDEAVQDPFLVWLRAEQGEAGRR